MITKNKTDSLATLIKQADEVFSKYIRLRDSDEKYSFKVVCFICGKVERTEWAHAMHFIDRDQMSTRYDEMNVHAGCENCNCLDPDHKQRYSKAMAQKYSADELSNLLWKGRSLQKFMRHELEAIIEKYSAEVKKLRKEKRL